MINIFNVGNMERQFYGPEQANEDSVAGWNEVEVQCKKNSSGFAFGSTIPLTFVVCVTASPKHYALRVSQIMADILKLKYYTFTLYFLTILVGRPKALSTQYGAP